jgi:hypothetical protein
MVHAQSLAHHVQARAQGRAWAQPWVRVRQIQRTRGGGLMEDLEAAENLERAIEQ